MHGQQNAKKKLLVISIGPTPILKRVFVEHKRGYLRRKAFGESVLFKLNSYFASCVALSFTV